MLTSQSRKAKAIAHLMPLEEVELNLGPFLSRSVDSTPARGETSLYTFRPDFGAAGPIRVGFDDHGKAVYLRIYEDSPPQWDLRKAKESSATP